MAWRFVHLEINAYEYFTGRWRSRNAYLLSTKLKSIPFFIEDYKEANFCFLADRMPIFTIIIGFLFSPYAHKDTKILI